jgi:hypothetical protein
MSNKYSYNLESEKGIVEALNFIKGRGVNIVWEKLKPSYSIEHEPTMWCPIRHIKAIPRKMHLYTNKDVGLLKKEIKRVLGLIRDYDEYDKELEDNKKIIEIKNLYDES